jgi:hypothetical protein
VPVEVVAVQAAIAIACLNAIRAGSLIASRVPGREAAPPVLG